MWIDYLAGTETEAAERFAEILDLGYAVGLAGVVYQEVVQGVSSRRSSTGPPSTWAPRPFTLRGTP